MDFLRQAYLDSVYWASDILERDFVVLDTETTDKIENGGEIIQLGIIDKESNTLMDQLIKPKGKISAGAARVHGITEKDVAKSPTFALVYLGVLVVHVQHCSSQPCLQHNLSTFPSPGVKHLIVDPDGHIIGTGRIVHVHGQFVFFVFLVVVIPSA